MIILLLSTYQIRLFKMNTVYKALIFKFLLIVVSSQCYYCFLTSFATKYRYIYRNLAVNANEEDGKMSITEEITPEPLQKRVTWTASAKGSVRVKELIRTVEEYMRLPASEYSVLSAEQIERLNDREFKCSLGTMNFFGTKITPILYVDVDVITAENKSIIAVTRAETTGSEIADKINGTFSISAINTVQAGIDDKNRKTLSSATELKIDCIVPPESKLPLRVIQSGGNFLMQSTLTVILQAFVRILASDFKRWSAGSDARDAIEGESLG